jgi:predicted aspartyl protease
MNAGLFIALAPTRGPGTFCLIIDVIIAGLLLRAHFNRRRRRLPSRLITIDVIIAGLLLRAHFHRRRRRLSSCLITIDVIIAGLLLRAHFHRRHRRLSSRLITIDVIIAGLLFRAHFSRRRRRLPSRLITNSIRAGLFIVLASMRDTGASRPVSPLLTSLMWAFPSHSLKLDSNRSSHSLLQISYQLDSNR